MSARAALDSTLDCGEAAVLAPECPEPLLRPFTPSSIAPLARRQPKPAALEHQVIAQELEIARRIQQSLLPKTFPRVPGFDLAGFCHTAHQVGGDFYDVVPLSAESLLLVVADVMGKGIPAAMFASTLRTLVRTLSEWIRHPADLLERMNRLLFEELSPVDMFITVQAAVVDAHRRTLVLANAGHCPLLLADGLSGTKALAPEGPPLGILPEANFAQQSVPIDEFTCALLYTDGLTDARDEKGELFGQPRLENWLCQNAQTNKTATQLKQHFLSELSHFQADASPPDDQTFLLLIQGAEATDLSG